MCAAVLHEYDWHATGRPQRTVLSLATNQTESCTIRLRRGRRVMQLTIDPRFTAASVRSLTTLFDMDEPQKMLEEQLARAGVAEAEVQAGTGACSRRAFAVDRTTVVSAAPEVADGDVAAAARRRRRRRRGRASALGKARRPADVRAERARYVLMAYSKALAPLPTGAWRLSALADHRSSFGGRL